MSGEDTDAEPTVDASAATDSAAGGRARCSRRRALALAGGSLAAAVTGVSGVVSASDHEAVVTGGGGQFRAENVARGETVYTGGDYLAAIQAAVDSLSAGRTTEETVRVDASGSTGSHSWDGDVKAVDLPSYTVVDQRGTMTVDDTGEDLIVPYRAESVRSIEIASADVRGNPRYGIWIKSCSDVTIGDVSMSLGPTEAVGIGVRIDDSDGGRTTGVSIDRAYVEGSRSHGVETYGVDDIDVGTVETVDTGGCGLLLNDTSGATVEHVDATRADPGGGYAGFRCANDCGPDVTVDRVDAVGCGRGLFTVSGSRGITVREVHLEANGAGALIQDTRDTRVGGGEIVDNGGNGIRIDSRSSDEHPHTRNVTVENLRVEGNGGFGVYETGPDTGANAIRNVEACGNGDGAVENVTGCSGSGDGGGSDGGGDGGGSGEGDGGDSGGRDGDSGGASGPISTGTYRITNVNSGKFLEVANAATEDGATVQQYGDTGHPCQEWSVEDTGDGVYRIENAHSGRVLDVEGAGTDDGANLIQWSDNGADNQRWRIVGDGGEYALEAVHSGKVADVYEWSTEDGGNVVQWTDTGGANQRWTFESV
jgi:hypothetical protein